MRPAHPGANVGVEPRGLPRQLVGEQVQRTHLLEQRLELTIVDRHPRRTLTKFRARVGPGGPTQALDVVYEDLAPVGTPAPLTTWWSP